MDTISITSASPVSLVRIRSQLAAKWSIEDSSNGSLVIHSAGQRAYVYVDDPVAGSDDYHIMIDYADVQLAKSILATIANDSNLVVDNDCGTVLPGDRFIAKCREFPEWDWRDVGR